MGLPPFAMRASLIRETRPANIGVLRIASTQCCTQQASKLSKQGKAAGI